MTPRSFFIIILKIFGLYFLLELIGTLPQLISFFPGFFSADSGELFSIVLLFLFVIGFYCLFIYLLLFKTNPIIDKLNLDRGFNEDMFSMKFERAQLYTAALMIIGGVILINEIPNLAGQIFEFVKEGKEFRNLDIPHRSYSVLVVPAVKIIIALLLIGERKRIVGFMERKKEVAEDDVAEQGSES